MSSEFLNKVYSMIEYILLGRRKALTVKRDAKQL